MLKNCLFLGVKLGKKKKKTLINAHWIRGLPGPDFSGPSQTKRKIFSPGPDRPEREDEFWPEPRPQQNTKSWPGNGLLRYK